MDCTPEKIRKQLFELSEPDYQKFASSLIPGEEKLTGIRLPVLRKLARSICKEDWQNFLRKGYTEYFEEVMLRGMVICQIPVSEAERIREAENFLPYIRNWSLCDSFCTGLRADRDPEQYKKLIIRALSSEQTYSVRFGLVMLLRWYLNDEYIEESLACFFGFSHPDYYARMAAAWGIAEAFAKYPEKTAGYLKICTLDDFTFQTALRKICESKKVSSEQKAFVRQLRRNPDAGR